MRKQVWGAIAAAVAAVAVFASSQQSLALWSDSASANGGTATADSVNLTVGSQTATSTAYEFLTLATGSTRLVPGMTVQGPITIKNSGTNTLKWRMQGTSPMPGYSLATYTVGSEGNCPAGANQAVPVGSAAMQNLPAGGSLQYPVAPLWTMATLASNSSTILCARFTANPDVPSGQTTSVTFTFQAEIV